MNILLHLRVLLNSFLVLLLASSAAANDYYQRTDVKAYIDQIVVEHAFDRSQLEQQFKEAVKQERAIAAMDKPAEAKPWPEYRDIFITSSRVNGGISFGKQYHELLEKAETEFGVPSTLIIAIIGVETFYGRNTGSFPVFSTLVTLGFDYPRRADFFRRELTEFLLLCRQEKVLQCDKLKGSYAGAMGAGQFISSSYRSYAIDFDNDGIRDLWNSKADAIGSVANFIKRHGWISEKPIGQYVDISSNAKDSYAPLLNKQFKPWLSLADLSERGIVLENFTPQEPVFSLFEYENEDASLAPKIWAGYNNFYVITRYNHSHRYAMVVHQLSQMIKQQY